jgi:hypothetical protein
LLLLFPLPFTLEQFPLEFLVLLLQSYVLFIDPFLLFELSLEVHRLSLELHNLLGHFFVLTVLGIVLLGYICDVFQLFSLLLGWLGLLERGLEEGLTGGDLGFAGRAQN